MALLVELASKKDIKDIFDLSNDPLVRQNSINSDPIKWRDHVVWFSNKIKSSACVYFVAKDVHDKLVAQVRFDRDQDNFEIGVVSISIAQDFRGKGLGAMILKDSTEKAFNSFNFNKILAYIKKENKQSINIFLKVGYKLVGQKLINSTEFLKFEISKISDL